MRRDVRGAGRGGCDGRALGVPSVHAVTTLQTASADGATAARSVASDLADASSERGADAIRERIREILESPQFAQRDDRFQRWLRDLLESIFGVHGSTASTLASVLVWTFLACAVVLLVVAVARAMPRRTPVEAEPVELARDERIGDLRRRARAAEAAGDLVLALRLYFTALVVALGERGDLDYRDAWTNRELLERGQPGPRATALLEPLVPALDRHSFGGEPATRDDVARLAALLDQVGGARA